MLDRFRRSLTDGAAYEPGGVLLEVQTTAAPGPNDIPPIAWPLWDAVSLDMMLTSGIHSVMTLPARYLGALTGFGPAHRWHTVAAPASAQRTFEVRWRPLYPHE